MYSVAWIDCLATCKSFGRSILMLGEHATENEISNKSIVYTIRKKQKISFFFNVPSFLLNNFTVHNSISLIKRFQIIRNVIWVIFNDFGLF